MLVVAANINESDVGVIDDDDWVDGIELTVFNGIDCVVEIEVVEIDSVVVEQTVFGTMSQSHAFLSNQLKIVLK